MTLTRLKKLRKLHKYTQSDLAKILEISQSHYYRLENDLIPISYDKLNKIANLYDTSIDYLLNRTDNYNPYPRSKKNPED